MKKSLEARDKRGGIWEEGSKPILILTLTLHPSKMIASCNIKTRKPNDYHILGLTFVRIDQTWWVEIYLHRLYSIQIPR